MGLGDTTATATTIASRALAFVGRGSASASVQATGSLMSEAVVGRSIGSRSRH